MKKSSFTGKYLVILLTATVIFAILVAFKLISTEKYQNTSVDPELTKIGSQSDDTETKSIEADLNNTEFDNLDNELLDIETEMDTSL